MSDYVFEGLEPKNVLFFFNEILKHPHPSFNEDQLSDYLVEFAKERKLEVVQDKSKNVLIRKKATKGMEDKDGIILQAHIDMVTCAEKNVKIDFDIDPITPYVDGDYIRAKGTTLGADDGIGVAMILAILDSKDIPHPALEAVFTTSEEVGLDGAKALDKSLLHFRKMINIDSEEENEVTIGCAGGCRANLSLSYKRQKVTGVVYEITLDGLIGGHSGTEIDKKHPNANILMGRVLYELAEDIDFSLLSLCGGSKDNAITCSCVAQIVLSDEDIRQFVNKIKRISSVLKNEFSVTEPKLNLTCVKIGEGTENVLSSDDFYKVMYLINMAPVGVLKMNQYNDGQVDTSSNLGVLYVENGRINTGFCLRSNLDSSKDWLIMKYNMLASALEARIQIIGDYPAWEASNISDFAKTFTSEYKKLTDKNMKITCIHAGLECALFYKEMKDLDAVSIGPKLYGVHTTDEHASISSIKIIWQLLKNVLAR